MKKLLMLMLGLALMAGCSSEPSKPAQSEKPQPKAPEYATGRTAFQRLYVAAHGWARDAQPYRLESEVTSDWKGKDGKSAIWRGSFASPSQRASRAYTWCGTDAPDAPPRGMTPGSQDVYSPSNSSTQVFDIGFLKTDSDKAFDVAQKHGGDKILAKSADTGIFYVLDWSGTTNELIWHVIYGASRDQPKLRVAVNATTGEFMRIEK